jgi:hypothetical protein
MVEYNTHSEYLQAVTPNDTVMQRNSQPTSTPLVCAQHTLNATDGQMKRMLTQLHKFCRQYDDSKALSAAKRSLLFEKVKADPAMLWRTDAISAQDISSKMLAPNRMSLNEIAVQSTLQLLRSLQEDGMNIASVHFCLSCSFLLPGVPGPRRVMYACSANSASTSFACYQALSHVESLRLNPHLTHLIQADCLAYLLLCTEDALLLK